MSEMIERVGRTLADHYMVDPDTCWPSYEAAARAAIEAMRIPTRAMRIAVDETPREVAKVGGARASKQLNFDAQWAAALAAALSEAPPQAKAVET